MDEIRADHGGMMLVPAGHGAGSAHGLIGVEETTAGFGTGAHGGDGVASGALASVHGTHDEDGGVGKSGSDAADRTDQFRFVLLFDVGGKARFVGAVVDDDKVGIAMLERVGEGCGVEST